MRISDLAGKNICIIGFGKEGKAFFEALKRFAPGAVVTIADKAENIDLPPGAQAQVGPGYMKNLKRFDAIVKSPGIPYQPEFAECIDVMTTSTQLFLEEAKIAGCTVIGVTGSKGKSTTSTLIAEILRAANIPVLFVGNIGEPAIAHIADLTRETVVVMELSSYQLMDVHISPSIAVITSFFPEHLDYHASTSLSTGLSPLELYMDAKKHIARFQKPHDVIFYSSISDGARVIALESPGNKIPYSPEDCPVPMAETKLIGEHNRGNIGGAYKVAMHMGVTPDTAKNAIRKFRGLPHRLQSLGIHHGIEWVDDAISTTPESAIAALDALGDRVATIILGGQDRGNDFSGLAKRIKQSSIKTVILFPGSGPRIRKALEEAAVAAIIIEAGSMADAVTSAQLRTQNSILKTPAIVLLSTASPSYGMFKNFEEKGEAFKAHIICT